MPSSKLVNDSAANLSVFDYSDYRVFMSDLIRIKTGSGSRGGYSLGAICRRSGALSKAHLSLVLRSKRDVSSRVMIPLGSALGLHGRELTYFETLIKFNQAQTLREKEYYFEQLSDARPRRLDPNLSLEQYRALMSWHCMVIRELSKHPLFKPDPKLISRMLKGRLSPAQARQALELLLKTGLAKTDDAGRFVPSEQVLVSGDEVKSLAIQAYHRSCLELAMDVLANDEVDQREFASINLILTPAQFNELKQRIKSLREEFVQMPHDENATDVCQININLLKLT